MAYYTILVLLSSEFCDLCFGQSVLSLNLSGNYRGAVFGMFVADIYRHKGSPSCSLDWKRIGVFLTFMGSYFWPFISCYYGVLYV